MPTLSHRPLGRAAYDTVWELQRRARGAIVDDDGPDMLFTVEHDPPVLTAGRRAADANLRRTTAELEQLGAQVRRVERGGDWTYHGPGQLVAYPIVALKRWNLRVHGFVEGLERAMAAVVWRGLEQAGVLGAAGEAGLRVGRRCGYPGCWLSWDGGDEGDEGDGGDEGDEGDEGDPALSKIGAVGVHFRRFVSIHGLALNIDPDPWGFDWIVPCGLAEPVTSLSAVARRLGAREERLASVAQAAGWLAELLPRTLADERLDHPELAVFRG